ncbi:conserved hypothetical protein [Neospora caninum Liverpool]|uniref:Transmembrane protein n=1 Tax=Neospora caninum (strain Liverpool) TaxID=572307 RepID=F0VCB7_NEOCL|nr:conserved hypothetical protein [Neospora caninum Liverpool]CBZ51251.1 conserved hypothetical protein [Neospora caninum Liverpool]CEL68566.1 TPA: hypothetical protein BN1204_043190 [Neospora caninum Liverpool]|eukprot:XP_003881284.1 conserved hypothetical protein [Neospora caninum Liverpool]
MRSRRRARRLGAVAGLVSVLSLVRTQTVCPLALEHNGHFPHEVDTDNVWGSRPGTFLFSGPNRQTAPFSSPPASLARISLLSLAFHPLPFSRGAPPSGGAVNGLGDGGAAQRRSRAQCAGRRSAELLFLPPQLVACGLSTCRRTQRGAPAAGVPGGSGGGLWGPRAKLEGSGASAATSRLCTSSSGSSLLGVRGSLLVCSCPSPSEVPPSSSSALFVKRRPTAPTSIAEDEETDEQFTPDPAKVRSRFGSLTEPGPFPEPPPESPYWPSRPAKRVTPVPAKLPRWHPRSPFPTLKPRGPLYPENPRRIRPPKHRQFKGAAPPPTELPPPPTELRRDFRTWVRDERYEYPQFTTIQASIRYRRRLKRSSRKLDWRLKSLQNRRMYFAWRRNMRDQETHRWLREKERWSLLAARYWKNQYALQAQRWISADDTRDTHAVSADRGLGRNQQREEDADGFEEAAGSDVEQDAEQSEEGGSGASQGEGQRARASSRSGPIRGSGAPETRPFGLGEDKAEDILHFADPDALAEVVQSGYRLPPMTACVADSPIPWWASAKGQHKWRGRKTATNIQSRWVNWANPRREVEAVVAGRLLRRQGRILRHLREKGIELRERLRRVEIPGDGKTAVRTEFSAEEENGDSLSSLLETEGGETSFVRAACSDTNAAEGEDVPRTDAGASEEHRQAHTVARGELTADARRLRAIEAAMDVAMMLGQSVVTKTSGASVPYDVRSPFMRSHTSSRRRRMRMRGRLKDSDQRNMTRQQRRLDNFARRQAAAAEKRAAIKEARRKAWQERTASELGESSLHGGEL